ncbi:MAG TPA: oligosaccharide flippase family protein [Acidobacteriaceae bacterium]|nr:oligosaccharide flippase family protein [Acidobacteriaceae bacterium]
MREVFVNSVAGLKGRGLLRDTTHLSIGQGFRLIIQATYFVLIARSLGPDAYGAFVTVVAMAALLGPFSGLGTPNLFIKNVRSGKRKAAICWGNGILATVLSGTLLSALGLGLSVVLHLKTVPLVVTIVCVSDLIFLKVTELAAFGFTALDQMKQTSVQSVVVSLLRLAGIVALIVTVHPVTLRLWVFIYLITTLLGTIYAVAQGGRLWGHPVIDLAALREDAAEGVFFSVAGSATTVYNDIDKIMLSRLADLAATGVYAAAYRVIDVTMTPVRSLAAAAYPQFFRKGMGGMAQTYPYALSLIAKTAIYGSLASTGLWLLAPLLPHVLGTKYEAVVPAVRWLALIPLLRCIHSFLADALSGAGLQRARTGIQVLVALINIALNVVILPQYSWRGAAWTSVGCDGLLVVLFWSSALYYHRRQPR